MAKKSLRKRPTEGAQRTSGPNKENYNPRKIKGNPTKGGSIFGKWHKPKLG